MCVGLQAELEAAYKELNCVKNKLRLQEAELETLRLRHSDKEDDYNLRYSMWLSFRTVFRDTIMNRSILFYFIIIH